MKDILTIQEFRKLKIKKSKYNNKPVIIDGIKFDSKKEGARYCELKLLLRAGEITDLKLQVTFDLLVDGKKFQKYIADFTYTRLDSNKIWRTIVEDVKSYGTRKNRVYMAKKKFMKLQHGIEILET